MYKQPKTPIILAGLELGFNSNPFESAFCSVLGLDKLNARILMNKLEQFKQDTNTTISFQIQVSPVNAAGGNLLENYLPPTMQALAYYIDLIQYEPVATTTIEPPFFAQQELGERTTPAPSTTTAKTTTKKPTSSWFQSPSWWSSTNAPGYGTTVKPVPTQKHKPGLYAPLLIDLLNANRGNNNTREPETDTKIVFDSDSAFIKWLGRQKKRQDSVTGEELNDNILDLLPLYLTRDINKELDDQDQHSSIENLDNFLQNYDDGYGKYNTRQQISGKKRVPPTKAYIDLLLMYDLLKRDAKAANLSKYEGYTDKMIEDLYELSNASSQKQLYTLFKRMLDRKDIQRSDVVSRSQQLVKELGDGNSVLSKSLMFYPPLQFIP